MITNGTFWKLRTIRILPKKNRNFCEAFISHILIAVWADIERKTQICIYSKIVSSLSFEMDQSTKHCLKVLYYQIFEVKFKYFDESRSTVANNSIENLLDRVKLVPT